MLLSLDRQFAEAVFTEWRDRYVANLCGYIRTYNSAELVGIKLPAPYRSKEWCNAAIHLLTIPELSIQDRFLRAHPKVKDAMVAAVIADGGVENLDGSFVELPCV